MYGYTEVNCEVDFKSNKKKQQKNKTTKKKTKKKKQKKKQQKKKNDFIERNCFVLTAQFNDENLTIKVDIKMTENVHN